MKRIKQDICAALALLIAAAFLLACAGCAIDNDSPDENEMGVTVCRNDEDCGEEGVCLEGETYKYCGVECVIDEDCEGGGDEEADEEIDLICHQHRCVDSADIEDDDTEEGK